ncbi:MAG: pentapeptide repeat-containing protein [Sideroxydans sp.]|nr:pentapeptide repeat-containing protein [Sideroxydans sp.]
MAEKTSNWIRDLLIVPLIVGILVVIATFTVPIFFGESKSLSYTIEPSLVYFDKTSVGNATVRVNDIPVSEVFTVKAKIWNSGNVPLKDISVRFEFSSFASDAKILAINHNTQPAKEFGAIKEEGSEGNSKRYVFQLLNPNDEDTIVFLTSSRAELKVYSKAEGLKLKEILPDKDSGFKWYFAALIGIMASFISSLVENIFRYIRTKNKSNEELSNNSTDGKKIPITAATLRAGFIEEKDLSNLSMREANLANANINYRKLTHANFDNSNLCKASFQGCDLTFASFINANLSETSFFDADLRNANLTGAKLIHTRFKKARLEGAILKECIVETCDFSATYNEKTIWPDGFDPIGSGAIYVQNAE